MGIPVPTAKVVKLATKDEKKTLGERTFACKAISFDIDNDLEEPDHVTLWICEDVKAGGLVAMRLEAAAAGATFEGSVIAYGTKGKALFGKTLEQIEADLLAKAKKDGGAKR